MRLLALLLASLALVAGEDLAGTVQAQALAYAEARAAAQPGSYAFRIIRPPTMPTLRPGPVSVEPSHLSKQDPSGRCFVTLRLLVSGQPAGLVRVDLEGTWKGELLRARSAIARKEPLQPDLFERAPFEGQIPPGAVTELPEGMRLRQPLQAGKWLTRADLEPIPLVNAGDRVRLKATSGSLVMETEALARSSGALGENVRLELPTHKVLVAKVTGSGEALLVFSK